MEINGDLVRRSAAIHRLRENKNRQFQYDQTGKIIDYWFNLKKKGLIPEKSGINPRDMLMLLPGAVMLEKNQASGGYRIRLLGTGNVARWGFEATNANYLNFAPPQQHNAISESFLHIIEQPCGLILTGDELYTSGRTVHNEMALFPVRTDDPGQAILFGLITAAPDQATGYASDVLASVFYTISKVHYINIGAGVPV